MGGGDLNLKKSWHPSTLRNIERVWKAEQKHEAEQKKIEQLQKELADERAKEEIRQYAEDQGVVRKKGDRLDWMYQGPTALVDREQYLTGRTVDKTFEVLEQLENKTLPAESELTQPGAIFAPTSCNVTVDLANKIREDPLFTIRKRETDSKKQLLNNPVKMKQLRELLELSLEGKNGKSKKKKKDKKRRRHSSDEEKKSKHKKKEEKNYKKIIREQQEKLQERKPENFYLNGKQYGLIGGHKKEPTAKVIKRSRSRSPQRPAKKPERTERHRESSKNRKLNPEEAARRCKEMMEDAKKWQVQREHNLKKYKEEEEKKDVKHKPGENAPDFLRPMLSKAATTGSVEGRVKQKMYNIQRNWGAMDKSFARR